jgi:uncharacterized cofD-like protein
MGEHVMKQKKVVCFGGGTGLSTLLRGLKHYYEPTAIVTMADSGGHSGLLRDELGVLPPGDVRACLVALADDENAPLIRDLFHYRFASGSYAGANVGNLLLAALNDMLGNFNDAVEAAHNLLGLKGHVVPVTLESVDLLAELEDGTIVFGEKNIDLPKVNDAKIKRVWLQPNASINPAAQKAIEQADAIIFGPGDLYTSIIPNLCVKGVVDAIKQSNAKTIYVTNIMTKHGETDDFQVQDFVTILEHYTKQPIAHVVYNTKHIPIDLLEQYKKEKASPVRTEQPQATWLGADVLSTEGDLARHDSTKLANVLDEVIQSRRRTFN